MTSETPPRTPPDREPESWTEEQCARLNAAQHDPSRHPYTCGRDSRHQPLIATRSGWLCADCGYRQTWAHEIPVPASAPPGVPGPGPIPGPTEADLRLDVAAIYADCDLYADRAVLPAPLVMGLCRLLTASRAARVAAEAEVGRLREALIDVADWRPVGGEAQKPCWCSGVHRQCNMQPRCLRITALLRPGAGGEQK